MRRFVVQLLLNSMAAVNADRRRGQSNEEQAFVSAKVLLFLLGC